ncbi:Ribosomal protein L34Ae [Carpediemonas membranifera]|uniref:Ribosomal protein L34Ae n=1 Tax=Carpediemonas membranifera TaxID=201153 RepID=A0A8J6BZB3_9EUKA|nr:Ribosomal protein L34Ae [Carpediemonas membranifera]|eukprot:KAG9395361.1 Ribosomal protein L34Ae [Carpediemonas membranifera]
MSDARVVYRRQCSYNTKGNKIRVRRTPGGRYVAGHLKKHTRATRCPVTGMILNGLPVMRPAQLHTASKSSKTVTRVYGGHLSHRAVRDRIVRAFLCEEARVAKAQAKAHAAAEAKASKKQTKRA